MSSLLTGVDASAAQNLPVTKTCTQCGAILPSSIRVCHFCDSSFSVSSLALEESSAVRAQRDLPLDLLPDDPEMDDGKARFSSAKAMMQETAWRGELEQRLKAYRTRRRKRSVHGGQCQFDFSEDLSIGPPGTYVTTEETPAAEEEDFSFTIAIGRPSKKQIAEKSPMEIDVSLPPEAKTPAQEHSAAVESQSQPGLHAIASIDDRRMAALIDLLCLLFAYGGFLGLFGSLGGHFTLSKLSVAVCGTTFAVVYLQYFALFTIFGGTTPGMMMRGLRVVSLSGETPSPKQMLLRSAGYALSAGTFFLGFLWALWDEDELTWHDRLSHTYLSVENTLADMEASGAAHSR